MAMVSAWQKSLEEALPGAQLRWNEPMDEHTSMRVGGPCAAMLLPKNGAEIASALRCCKEQGIPCFVMGNGTNLIVRDGGYNGLIVKIGEDMAFCRFRGARATVGAGLRLITLARDVIQKGMSGTEFAGGIPGTVGGAVAMNAGAYGGDMAQVVRSVTYLDPETLQSAKRQIQEGDMGYRTSIFSRNGWIVTEAELQLGFDTDGQARINYDEFSRRRREKQPLTYPSAGSFFKRPQGNYAGSLIEQAGLKGRTVGGAQVSELHAGFLINTGGATAGDVLALMGEVQEAVLRSSGVKLEPEVKIIGED